METSSRRHAFKKRLGDKLLYKLQTMYPDEFKEQCFKLEYDINDLALKEAADFLEKGMPSDMSNMRYVHYEERRQAKILKIASEMVEFIGSKFYSATPSMEDLLKGLNISNSHRNPSGRSSVILESSSIFHKPADLIQYNVERAKQKFNKSLEIIKRLEGIKAEEKKKTENIIRRSQEREKKTLNNLNKIEEEHGKQTLSVQEQRKKILQKKRDIESNLDSQFIDYGMRLERRMNKLSVINQRRLREMVAKQRENIKKRVNDDYSKITNDEHRLQIQENEIKEMIGNLHQRIEQRIASYEDNVRTKVISARENNSRVDKIFSQSLTDYNKKTEERLQKVIAKSLASEQKRNKKQEKFNKYSSEVRNSVRSSFMRTNKGIEEVNQLENKRIQQIEQRVSSKTKIYNDIKSKFQREFKEKRQKNYNKYEDHTAKYSKALESQARLRSKVLDKHMRINILTEDLKHQKFLISNSKRKDNFEIQKIRNTFSSPLGQRYRSKSKFEGTF